MDKEAYVEKVEKLIERINGLTYRFVEPPVSRDAAELLEEAETALENYLDLVSEDEGCDDDNWKTNLYPS